MTSERVSSEGTRASAAARRCRPACRRPRAPGPGRSGRPHRQAVLVVGPPGRAVQARGLDPVAAVDAGAALTMNGAMTNCPGRTVVTSSPTLIHDADELVADRVGLLRRLDPAVGPQVRPADAGGDDADEGVGRQSTRGSSTSVLRMSRGPWIRRGEHGWTSSGCAGGGGRGGQAWRNVVVQPPSTGTTAPVMKDESSETRNAATRATSSAGLRPIGCRPAAASRRAFAADRALGAEAGAVAAHVGVDVARADGVHAHAQRAVVDGELAGQVHDPALGRAVGGRPGRADEAVRRGDVDDPAGAAGGGQQVRHRRPRAEEGPVRFTASTRASRRRRARAPGPGRRRSRRR